MGATAFSCWMIGADSLLVECGDILLRAGHELRGLITDAPDLAAWAQARRIPVYASDGDFAAELRARPFDHLFAITHLAPLSERILKLPTRSAINFHDGPLPEYAGLNAPAWALINGEAAHGITWHEMKPEIDGGPILKQRSFELAPQETSFSLNAKCFEVAIDSFAELVAELSARTIRPLMQDARRRSVYRRHQRPPASCSIDWTRAAGELESLVRALDFGRYPNVLGRAKIHHAGGSLLVTRARAEEDPNGAAPDRVLNEPDRILNEPDRHLNGHRESAVPGTVLSVGSDEVRVTTGRGVLALRGLAELTGRELEPARAAQLLALAPGVVLDQLAPERAERASELDRRMSRSERSWVRRLAELDPIELPLLRTARPDDALPSARESALEIEVPPELTRRFPEHPLAQILMGAFCAFLARLARRRVFDLGYADAALRREVGGEAWISARVPLRIEVDLDQGLAALLEQVASELGAARELGPWLHDLIARHPKLDALRQRGPALLPVVVECRDAFGEPDLADGALWALEVRAATAAEPAACRFVYDAGAVDQAHAASLRAGFTALLESLAARPDLALGLHAMVSPEELELQRVQWNQTALRHRREVCVHTLFEEQVARTPAARALVCAGEALTYAELDARAERLADELARRGMGAGHLVGIFVERGLDLVVAVLGTLKAGAAYVPLDPVHPAERLAYLLEDSAVALVVTQEHLTSSLPTSAAQVLRVDVDLAGAIPQQPTERADAAQPTDPAYVIYTSGSTGRPKGVLIEHRNVASFFAAMDERISHAEGGLWLALTSLSFDISVLELLWPLCRGFEVIVHPGDELARHRTAPARPSARAPVDFSLFFFASDEGERSAGYRLLLEGARFADEHDFRAVWTPERHFHAFGGLFPNPAVTGAAIAAITSRVEIRAGSVVLPLHHPIRVAEEWALVDNLSDGRVGISFASGWRAEDFVLAPTRHARAKEEMFAAIELVRRLWRGEELPFPGPDGALVGVRTLPRPVQSELPVWITAAGNPETYVAAGRIGANVLTHLLGQTVEQLAPKIRAYREAREAAGFDPAAGVVTLMLHTFVGEDEELVREAVRQPLERYLASSLSMIQEHAWAFPAFKRPASNQSGSNHSGSNSPEGSVGRGEGDLTALSTEERAAMLAHARERYYETSGLFGTPARCLEQVARLRAIDVDEIACLIDFGLPAAQVLASLPVLDRVRSEARALSAPLAAPAGPSLATQLTSERVTHLQCTPSQARILCSDPEARRALSRVRHMYVGGEALPAELAAELAAAVGGSLTNMYGPTETTIWSATHELLPGSTDDAETGSVALGRPIANTRLHVLDERFQPLPIGVAGELFIAGDGVARGYLHRPELDAERFLPESLADPSAAGSDARMYRTGDLVRYRADGVLEFLGRIDHQIKIRGHRVEPGEIEALLLCEEVSEHSLAEAVVVAREKSPGDQRLIAYLVPRGTAPDEELLRARLAAHLPEHMLPAQYVFLEAMPHNPNGKLDRSALPEPDARLLAECALPASELETRLAELWRETLALARVGVEDNFFDLGGHSLLIVRLQRRMHEVTRKPVPLTDLFRFPTIRSLAQHLASGATPDTVEAASLRGRRRRKSKPQRGSRVVES